MAHASKSPLFGALESVVEEQVGRDVALPERRRRPAPRRSRRVPRRAHGLARHRRGRRGLVRQLPRARREPRRSRAGVERAGSGTARAPLRDVPVAGIARRDLVRGVPPDDRPRRSARRERARLRGQRDVDVLRHRRRVPRAPRGPQRDVRREQQRVPPRAARCSGTRRATRAPSCTARPRARRSAYLASSEFCGACHDVRLFGTDVLGAAERGEHFKRLRNAYSEWRAWADAETRAGREPATCQDCHMSLYPGVCAPASGAGAGSPGDADCPKGTRFAPRPRVGRSARGVALLHERRRAAVAGFSATPARPTRRSTRSACPSGSAQRRDLLLRHTFRFAIDAAGTRG